MSIPHVWLLLPLYALLAVASPFKAECLSDSKDYLVSPLPGWDELPSDYAKPIQYAGQLELFPENSTEYFFWKVVDSEKVPENKNRTTFWLQGGPGCSSIEGVFLEHGPFKLDDEEKIVVNENSWHKRSDMVYVDQPTQVGYSDGELIHELSQVQVYFLKFLEKYFELFPEDLKNEIYVAGESFGGQYVPYVADAILKRNENLTDGGVEYKLKGIMIGNGYVSPNEQFLSYIDYFKDHFLIDDSNPNWDTINEYQSACQEVVDGEEISSNENRAPVCEALLGLFLNATRNESAPADQQCLNVYDYNLHDSFPSCGDSYPPLSDANRFLNRWDVQADLNVESPVNYTVCNTVVQETFTAPNSPPSKLLLPDIVSQIPIVLYNGASDILCNTDGVLKYLSNMTWNGATGFSDTNNRADWIVEDKKAGWVLQDRNLTFINIFNASHYVPYSQPTVAKFLLDFVTGETTEDAEGFVSQPKEQPR
ncbi:hypothetical protein CANMA_000715 [Candida margitis]|uniref:uncharacterized protein n=1 Tax=Candida margitis TaxID=1775924 RepID=UPI002225D32B|nr:uncharacterized protein CANMA_000715 [Candida margitis]KAI5970104.1 hypothetical protein CANMA_000715 [Candida margitis]